MGVETMGGAEERGGLGGDRSCTIHITHLRGEKTGGVGLNGEKHEIEHRLDQLAGCLVIGIQVRAGGVSAKLRAFRTSC